MCASRRIFVVAAVMIVSGVSRTAARADVPQQINHQGVVSVNGTPFNGAGLFRFAIVDRATGVNLWCNDDNDPANTPQDCTGELGVVPTNAVSLSVANGVYTVRLGDPGLANMTALPSVVFNNANTALRIWFDDGVNDNQQLTPDHVLTPSPYSHRSAIEPPLGSIVAWHKNAGGVPAQLPNGWVECNGQFATDDPSTPVDDRDVPNLNGEGRFLRGSATSGDPQGDEFKQHSHSGNTGDDSPDHSHQMLGSPRVGHSANPGNFVQTTSLGPDGWGDKQTGGANTRHTHGFSTNTVGGSETRPVNMSVVWIMRVK